MIADRIRLERVETQDAAALDALARGRLHHAWLLTGPEGVGKASFALRFALRLLDAEPSRAGTLDVADDDRVARLVAAQAHPDLMVLEREVVDGRAKRSIAVDAARKLPEFFARTPGMAPYRVAIVDSADDLNDNSANALLKTLEEPPPRGVLLLVSHAPGGLLPTIRSRCRRLGFAPWPETAVADFVERRAGATPAAAARAAALAGGAPGRALSALSDGSLDLDASAEALLERLPSVDEGALSALADRFRRPDGMTPFLTFLNRLAGQVGRRAEGASGARWADAWERLQQRATDAEAVNLDRADVLWTTVAELRRLAKAA